MLFERFPYVMTEMVRSGGGSKAKLGRYEMLTPIAAGGMASVWAARLVGTSGFSKIVAIKSMLPDLADEPEYRTMFLDEARIASKLRHPNVCETFDLGEEDGELFMAMEWVDGVSLHRLLRNADKNVRPIALDVAARIIAGACAGLHAAHEAVDDDGTPLAVVHRDVSPHNLLISVDGHVKVTDFGVAKARGKKHATSAGQAKGKLAYMAPEQLRSTPVVDRPGFGGGLSPQLDRRADVFSLGCVLYEITTGVKPFDAETDLLLMRALLDQTPTPPSTLPNADHYPAELERIILRAMAKDPNERFASAEGLRIALERFLDGRVTERDVALLVHERCQTEIDARRASIHGLCGLAFAAADAHAAAKLVADAQVQKPDRGRQWTIALGVLVIAFAFGSLFLRRPIENTVVATSSPPAVSSMTAVAADVPSTRSNDEEILRPVAETPARVTLHLDPPGAMVVVDGDALQASDSGNFVVERPAGGEMRVVLLKAAGHVDRLYVIDQTTPPTVEVSLTPEKEKSAQEHDEKSSVL